MSGRSRHCEGTRGAASGRQKISDDEIAQRALKIISWDTMIPENNVQVKVENAGSRYQVKSSGIMKSMRRKCCPQLHASKASAICSPFSRARKSLISRIALRILSNAGSDRG